MRLSLVTFVTGALGGFLGAIFIGGSIWLFVLLAIGVYFYFHVGVLGQLAYEPGLDPAERERLLSRIRWFGPLGMIELAGRLGEAKSGN